MSLAFWEPFRDDFFPEAMRTLANASSGTLSGQRATYGRGILLDVKETPQTFDIKADLPGLPKEAIKVSVESNILTISVQQDSKKEGEGEDKGVKFHRSERSSMFMQRSIRLPETADLAKIKAKYENGTLSLDVPKVPNEKRSLTVAIG
eukprot:jgi/Botrbrau1/9631/Bobra.0131s0011.1